MNIQVRQIVIVNLLSLNILLSSLYIFEFDLFFFVAAAFFYMQHTPFK